jgi:hypothetical protein
LFCFGCLDWVGWLVGLGLIGSIGFVCLFVGWLVGWLITSVTLLDAMPTHDVRFCPQYAILSQKPTVQHNKPSSIVLLALAEHGQGRVPLICYICKISEYSVSNIGYSALLIFSPVHLSITLLWLYYTGGHPSRQQSKPF